MSAFSQRFYHTLRWPARIAFTLSHPKIRVRGRENLPEGGAVLCGNHSSFSDAVWVVIACWLDSVPRTMAKKELFSIPVLGYVIRHMGGFPVDREINDINAVKTAMRILRDGDKLVIFPEGTRVRKGKAVKPHGGAVLIANKSQVPIVPVYITKNKRFLAPIDIIFGEPYEPVPADARVTAELIEELSEDLMQRIYTLGDTK